MAYIRKILKYFHEYPSGGNRVLPCRLTDRQMGGQRDMMKLIIAFRNFAIAPKKIILASKVINSKHF
jgi:hypothetical protein